LKAATNQIESGAKKIPDGKIGEGVEETAKGIGKTVSEGAKYSGEKLKEASGAAEPAATLRGLTDGHPTMIPLGDPSYRSTLP
jgi:hypothetical protein